MVYFLLICSIGFFQLSFSACWNELLEMHLQADDNADNLIQHQYQTAHANRIPRIADACIKQIPIHENNEELIDIVVSA